MAGASWWLPDALDPTPRVPQAFTEVIAGVCLSPNGSCETQVVAGTATDVASAAFDLTLIECNSHLMD